MNSSSVDQLPNSILKLMGILVSSIHRMNNLIWPVIILLFYQPSLMGTWVFFDNTSILLILLAGSLEPCKLLQLMTI